MRVVSFPLKQYLFPVHLKYSHPLEKVTNKLPNLDAIL